VRDRHRSGNDEASDARSKQCREAVHTRNATPAPSLASPSWETRRVTVVPSPANVPIEAGPVPRSAPASGSRARTLAGAQLDHERGVFRARPANRSHLGREVLVGASADTRRTKPRRTALPSRGDVLVPSA
jgi:hypothetical protein